MRAEPVPGTNHYVIFDERGEWSEWAKEVTRGQIRTGVTETKCFSERHFGFKPELLLLLL